MFRPRTWQVEAQKIVQEIWQSKSKNSVSIVATPGAGKTSFVLMLMSAWLNQFAIVVVPTSELRTQWAQSAAKMGIRLDPCFTNNGKRTGSGYHGIVVTYQQIDANPRVFASIVSRRQTITYYDEIHHCNQKNSWGRSLEKAFKKSVFHVLVTGTAWNSVGEKLSFFHYDADDKIVIDYNYSYERAVKERVCRPLVFFPYQGLARWEVASEIYEHQLSDDIGRKQRARALSMLLSSRNWIMPVLRDAHNMLLSVQSQGHKDASGLIVARDREHAKWINEMMREITDTPSLLAVSGGEGFADGNVAIQRFKKTPSANWITSVNMMSEGQDVPRLRVLVYLSTVTTELYWRQVTARIIRYSADVGGGQTAYVFMPADKNLIRMASSITREIAHAIPPKLKKATRRAMEGDFMISPPVAMEGENMGVDAAIQNGMQVQIPLPHILPPTEEEKLRTQITNLVGQYVRASGKTHKAVYSSLKAKQGVGQAQCTLMQLKQRVAILRGWINAT